MAVPTGIEPAISCVTGRHVNRYTTGPYASQRPTLTGHDNLLPSALKSLTTVFGMGTGVTSSPSSRNDELVRSKLNKT